MKKPAKEVLDDIKAFDEKQQIQPTQQLYASPFGYKFGTSSVDLSIEANHNTMKNEYDAWWSAKGENRANLQEAFNQKYFNMSTADVRKAQREQALEDHNPLKRLDNTEGIGVVRLKDKDVLRHKLVKKILAKYN